MPYLPSSTQSRLRVALLLAATALSFGCGGFPVLSSPGTAVLPRVVSEWQRVLHVSPLFTFMPREHAVPAYDREDGTVIVGSNGGAVSAYGLEDARERWHTPLGGPVWAEVCLEGDKVYVGTGNGEVWALDRRDGHPLWERPFAADGAVLSRPAAAAGRLFVTFDNNEIRAIDSGAGDELWRYRRDHAAAFTLHGQAGPAVVENLVVTGFSDGVVVGLQMEDGVPLWERSLVGSGSRFKDADGTPVVADGTIYTTSNSGGVYALRPGTGETIWHHAVQGASSPAVTSDSVYVTVMDPAEVRRIDRATGKLLWRSALSHGPPSAPTVGGGYLFTATTGPLVVMDAETGRIVERIGAVAGFAARPAVAQGRLLLVSDRGHLHAMGIY